MSGRTRAATGKLAVLAATSLMIAAGPVPMDWHVDEAHSGIEFSVKHFFTPVTGQFEEYQVDVQFDRDNPANSTVSVRIDVASIDTGNEDRDAHLLSGDFFEADRYPTITFESEEVREVGEDELMVRGPLRIKDRVHQVELPITVLGIVDVDPSMRDMLGGVTEIASFDTELTIDRSDFGVGVGSWAAALVVGHDVEIEIAIEANR